MAKCYDYKVASRLNVTDPSSRLLYKLNAIAFVGVMVGCIAGVAINYFTRMRGEPGGMYLLYILCGVAACLVYPYLHEWAHALATLSVKGKAPRVKFGKLAAYCGSPDILYTKGQYFYAAVFPFVFFCAALVPLCVFLPPVYFPIPFMPLTYNVFGSVADAFMIRCVMRSPRYSIIVDTGTEVVTYIPVRAASRKI